MVKFLLTAINAKYIHSNPAIYSLRAYAGKELQEYIRLTEFTVNQSLQDILAEIYSRKPDAIGFSCYIWNWRLVQDLIRELPKLLPDTDVWLGGPEVSFDAEKVLEKYPAVTGIMVGEGEATFKELLECYRDCAEKGEKDRGKAALLEKLKSCPGLCLPGGATGDRELLELSDIPFLYENLNPFSNRIIYYESSRGCPYRCSYCLSSVDKTVRFRDIDVVKKELQFFLDKRVKQVKFVDRTFNCNHSRTMEIWQYLQEHDNGVTNFHFEISGDNLREDEILLLNRMRPGLVQLEIGVQSVNPATIAAINRVMNIERLEQMVGAIRKGQNVHRHLDLIAGLPYEDYESFARSFDRVYAMQPQQLQLGFLKVLKGSPMADMAEKYGIFYLEEPPYEVLFTRWLSYGDICRLKRIEEVLEIYYNSGQYSHTLPFLQKAFAGPFAMFEAMAAFFAEKGYFFNSPARTRRYEILLDFAKEYDEGRLPVYKELLIFDLYLRENLKSRPAFAPDLKGHKETIHGFYKKASEINKYLPDYEAYDWKQTEKMTHLEPFSYPVWDLKALMKEEKNKKVYILFDYKNKNPLNHEAAVQILCDSVL